jgi:cytochrome P450
VSWQVVREPRAVTEVLRRYDDFVPTNALTSVVTLHPATLRALSRVGFALPPVLASATGQQHRTMRQVVARFFTPEKVAAIRPRVIELTRAYCRTVAEQLQTASADLNTVAHPVPPMIMSELIGLPLPQLRLLKRWSQDSLELFWGWPDASRQLELAVSASDFYCWLREQVDSASGADSLFAALRRTGVSRAEICSLGYFLVIAGQETTSQLAAITYYRALQQPGWPELAEYQKASEFVRGVLAAESPVHTWRRIARQETQLNGDTVPAGAEILLELSGNHPPGSPPTAYTLAFGCGLHRCLGAKLAEVETVAMLQETARLLPDLRLSGADPEWLRLLSFRTPRTVAVTASAP